MLAPEENRRGVARSVSTGCSSREDAWVEPLVPLRDVFNHIGAYAAVTLVVRKKA